MKELIKELKSIEKEKNGVRKAITKIHGTADIDSIVSKSSKYYTCQGCHTRYPAYSIEALRGVFVGHGRVARCPVCKLPMTSKAKLKKLEELDVRMKELREEEGKTSDKLRTSIKNTLENIKDFVAHTKGTYKVNEWGNKGKEFELGFRNDEYATHESHGFNDKDPTDLYNEIKRYVKSKCGDMFIVDVSYGEKEWFFISVSIK